MQATDWSTATTSGPKIQEAMARNNPSPMEEQFNRAAQTEAAVKTYPAAISTNPETGLPGYTLTVEAFTYGKEGKTLDIYVITRISDNEQRFYASKTVANTVMEDLETPGVTFDKLLTNFNGRSRGEMQEFLNKAY